MSSSPASTRAGISALNSSLAMTVRCGLVLDGGQDRAEGLVAGHRGVAQPYCPGDARPGEAGAFGGAFECAEGERCLLEERPAGRGERNLAAGADEQVGAERVLELANLVAQRRLGDVEARGCAAEVQLLRDGQEVAQQPRFEIHSRKLSPAWETDLGRRLLPGA